MTTDRHDAYRLADEAYDAASAALAAFRAAQREAGLELRRTLLAAVKAAEPGGEVDFDVADLLRVGLEDQERENRLLAALDAATTRRRAAIKAVEDAQDPPPDTLDRLELRIANTAALALVALTRNRRP